METIGRGQAKRGQWTVYLLHLDEPLGNPANPLAWGQHYVGITNNLDARLDRHENGLGAKMLAAAVQRKIGWKVYILAQADSDWEARHIEWRVKRKIKATTRLCPDCGPLHPKGPVSLFPKKYSDPEYDPFDIPAPSYNPKPDWMEIRGFRRPYHNEVGEWNDPDIPW